MSNLRPWRPQDAPRPVAARSAKPPVCLHEPILREGIEAATRLVHGLYLLVEHRSGEPVCDHHVPKRAACQTCDLERLTRAFDLLQNRGAVDSTDCFDARVSELRATISGQTEEIFNLRSALRASEGALQSALGRSQ